MRKVLRFLASLKLAVYIIAATAGLCVVAAIYGADDIYSSWMMRLLLAVFWLNLFCCTILHLPGVWRTLHKKCANVFSESGFADLAETQDLKADIMLKKAEKAGLKAESASYEEGEVIFAHKGRLSLVAPHILHLAILTILIGALLTSFGVKGAVICTDNQRADLPKAVAAKAGSDYDIYVNSFRTVYDTDGAVDNWETDLVLRLNGEEVAQGVVSVNHPLKYKNLSIYQNSYKYQYLVNIEGINDEVDGTYSLPDNMQIDITDDLILAAHGHGEDEVLLYTNYKGEEVTYALDLNQTMIYRDNILFSYWGENNYTILQVKYAPGTKVVFFGFILAALASMFFWCGRYRELYLRKSANGNWQYRLYCKNPEIAQKLKEDILKEI